MNSNTLALSLVSAIVFGLSPLYGFDIDENELFSDSESIMDSTQFLEKGSSIGVIDSTMVDFSGEISSIATLNGRRNFFDSFNSNQLTPGASMVGNFSLDVRLPGNLKSFGNMELVYSSADQSARFHLRELFADMNINRRIYLRTGKQVLQWGRCNLWNPTDLINVERKSFLPKTGSREGTYGIRAHFPLGVSWNFYGFMDMNDLSSVDSLAATAKVEFLIGGTEMSLAVWDKRGRDAVLGFDISTKVLGFQVASELSLTKGTNYNTLAIHGGTPVFGNMGEGLITRVAINATRFFDYKDVKDRIITSAEFYYNQGGDKGNLFNDPLLIRLRDALLDSPQGELRDTARHIYSTYYEPNSYSRFYAALFTSFSRFFHEDLTLSANALINLDQHCAVISSSLNYRSLHNFFMGLTINSMVGPENTEYTLFKEAFSVQVTAGMGF